MPTPPKAASDPFEILLAQLSSEFHRLQEEKAALADENVQLRAAFIGAAPPCTTVCAEGDDQQNVTDLTAPCYCLAPVKMPDAIKAPDPAVHVRETQVEVFHHPNSEVRSTLQISNRDDSIMVNVNTNANARIMDVFERLDVHMMGRLYFQDLMLIMRSAGKAYESKVLLNAMRLCNDQELLDVDCSDVRNGLTELERFESLDVEGFTRLMNGSLPQIHADRDTEACVKALWEACCQKAYRPGKSTKRASEVEHEPLPSESPNRALFEAFPSAVIFLNMVLTGLSIDNTQHESVWEWIELVFAAYYLAEFIIKCRVLGCKGYFWGREWLWNWFDVGCLTVSFIDPVVEVLTLTIWQGGSQPDLSALMMIKMFRLARLARLVRILRFKIFQELKIMIMGVFSGLRVLSWAIVLLVMLTYIIGVALTYLAGPHEPEFRTVSRSMLTLFRCWTEGCAAYDGTPLVERMREKYGFAVMVSYILITMFVSVGVFNLIMAIFIDNVLSEQNAKKHKEIADGSKDIELKFRKYITEFVTGGRSSMRGTRRSLFHRSSRGNQEAARVEQEWELMRKAHVCITRSAFRQLLKDENFSKILGEAEIESSNHFELFDVLDADMGGELSMDELTTGLMKLRGPVTKADIVAVRLKVRHLTKILESMSS